MISKKTKDFLSGEKRMEKCERCTFPSVQWHHVFLYAGEQIPDAWNIAAACKKCHDMATPHKNEYVKEVREFFEWNALMRMTDEDMKKYHKKDWIGERDYLLSKKSF